MMVFSGAPYEVDVDKLNGVANYKFFCICFDSGKKILLLLGKLKMYLWKLEENNKYLKK